MTPAPDRKTGDQVHSVVQAGRYSADKMRALQVATA